MSLRTSLALIAAVLSAAAFGQDSASATSASSSFVAALDTYAKVIGVVLTALATLFGLPIVFLTYKKTRAEIAKLDLEATALRAKLPAQTEGVANEESASSTQFSE